MPRHGKEADAQEHPDLYRQLIAAVRDYAIFALDATGHVLTWNPGAERFKGYKAEEIIGRHFSTFYPEEDVRAGKPDMELVVARREGRFEDEGWRVRKDGTQFWANVVITALRDETGYVFGFGKVTRDLTERRAAHEQAIEDARHIAEAEASNRAKNQFLATMSHELRTPLNAISGYVELLESGVRGPVNEQQTEDLRRIRRSGQHLLGIINDLLNFSRLGAGRVSYDLVDFPLNEALDAVRMMVEPMAAAKSTHLAWPKASDAIRVHADVSKVEQILLNLITNAVKFTPAGGRIDITVPGGDELRVVIGDNGIGIPADQLESIFEPFVQVGRTLSSHHEGTGLGLSISRDLARAMGGELTATSVAGLGSEFTLTLPAAK